MDEKIELVRTVAIDNQRNISEVKVKVDIFDKNLEKLTDISLNVSKLLAVHEQRLEAAEKAYSALPELIEQHRLEAQDHAKRAIDTARKIDTDLRVEIDSTHKDILSEIKNLSGGMTQLRLDVNNTTATIKSDLELKIANEKTDLNKKMTELGDKVSAMQKIVWLVTGGAAVVGAVASQMSGLLHISIH